MSKQFSTSTIHNDIIIVVHFMRMFPYGGFTPHMHVEKLYSGSLPAPHILIQFDSCIVCLV